LQIDGAAMPENTIRSFLPGDALDLASVAFTGGEPTVPAIPPYLIGSYFRYSLLLTEGGVTYSLALDAYAADETFIAEASGGGTLIFAAPNVQQVFADQAELDAFGPVPVYDTGADILANLSEIVADMHIGSLHPTDGALTLSVAQAQALIGAGLTLVPPAGSFNLVADKAANLKSLTAAQIARLPELGVNRIQATDQDVALTVTQRAALGAAGVALLQPYSGGSYEAINYTATGALGDVDYFGVANKPYVSFDVIYGADGKRASETWLASGRAIYQTETWNGDGSFAITNMGGGAAFGAAYTSYDVSYNALGKPVSETWSNKAEETRSYGATGALTEIEVTGIVGADYVETETFYGANGQPTIEMWLRAGGAPYQTKTWNSDGSSTIAVTASGSAYGSAYTFYDASYNAAGKPVSETWWPSGTTETWSYDDASGALTETVVTGVVNPNYVKTETIYGANGKPSSETWSTATGNYMSETWAYDADGAYETVTTEPATSAYLLISNIYSAPNQLAAQARVLDDGAGALQLFASGVTVAQEAGALSFEVGVDAFDVLKGIKQTSIAGFVASGANADVLNLQLSMFDPSWFSPGTTMQQEAQALLGHATGSTNTVISDNAGDTLTLLGVSVSTLMNNLADIKLS